MEHPLWLDVVSRILHVGTAIVLLGGTVFARFVLMPAAEKLSPDAHDTLRTAVGRIWKIVVHVSVVLLLATGFYNYLVVTLPAHRGDAEYNMLIGIKILLALIVFALAEVLVGRAAAFEKLRQNRKTWLVVLIVLAAVIVAISGYLKVRPAKPPAEHAVSILRGEHPMHGVPECIHAKRLA